MATILLIAPTVHHRLYFRQQDKEFLVVSANRLMLAGSAVLALAIVGAMVLVTNFLFDSGGRGGRQRRGRAGLPGGVAGDPAAAAASAPAA